MKNIRTIFVVMMVAILGLSTSFDASAYDAKACSMVANKKSACNQGAEPFCDFISKFKTNKNFRKSRVKACSKSYCSDCIEGVGTICIGYDNLHHGFKTYKSKKKWIKCSDMDAGGYYEMSAATWSNVSKNKVKYSYDAEDDECGWGLWYIFERINGKWYLTHYVSLP